MQTTVASRPEDGLIAVPGPKLDGAQAAVLHRQLDAALTHHARVVLDLRAVLSVAPGGWKLLVAAHQQALAQGGALTVCSLQPAVRMVFELIGLHRLIACYPTPATALG